MEIRQELLQNNPFASSAASNPWDNSAPDILSLNDSICEQLFSLIQSKAKTPQASMAGLILGEAGSGKTHMLKRILARIMNENINAVFVSVRAFSVPETVMQDMWHEIYVNLLKKRDEKTSQFNFIVSRIMNIYRHHNALNGKSTFDSAKGVSYFQNEMPGIHADFLKAIFACCDPFSAERREAAMRWFSGEIDDELPALLGVKDRALMSLAALEGEAERMILSLGLVLQLCKVSMVVCFDQLDAMEDKVLINSWGNVVVSLVNNAVSILPLAFLKDSTWNKFFLPALADHVTQRFSSKFVLEGCTLDQAYELLRLRIKSLFREGFEDKYNWLMGHLKGKLMSGDSPRIILNIANQAIISPDKTAEPDDVLRVLDKAYREECDKVAADFVRWQSDAKRLQNALEIYLNHNSGFTAIERSGDKYVSLAARHVPENAPERDCFFIINTARHFQTAKAALKHGAALLQGNPDKICWYITDFFPNTWKVARAALDDFEKLGGIAIFLDQQQAVSWYGLGELSVKIRSGDVTLLSSGGALRTASADDLNLYLERGFKTNFLEVKESVKREKNGDIPLINEDELVKNVSGVLKNSPMRFMKVEMLLGHLAGLSGNVTMTRERLLEFLGGQSDKFSLFSSGDGTLVMLK